MTKKERIVQLELKVADLQQEIAALKQMVCLKQDKFPPMPPAPYNPWDRVGPGLFPSPAYPSTNPTPPWVVTSEDVVP